MAKYTSYFSVDTTHLEAKCKLCLENAIIKFSATSKTNLKTHIEGVHRHATAAEKAEAAAAGLSTLNAAFQGPSVYANQEALTGAVCDMIIDLHLPVSIVDKSSFRKVLAVASKNAYKPVCARTMRERIIKKSKWTFDFQEYNKEFGKPSTTLDIWSSRKRRGYMDSNG